MYKSFWTAGILGGFAAFFWGFLGMYLLPLHSGTLLKFTNEAEVTATLAANAPESGLYMLPNPLTGVSELSPEQFQAEYEASIKQWQTGPTAFVAVRADGAGDRFPNLLFAVVNQVIAGLLLAWLLARTRLDRFWPRVGFVVTIAAVAGVMAHLPEYNWMGFPAGYTLASMFSLISTWFVGGIVIAKMS